MSYTSVDVRLITLTVVSSKSQSLHPPGKDPGRSLDLFLQAPSSAWPQTSCAFNYAFHASGLEVSVHSELPLELSQLLDVHSLCPSSQLKL